MGEIIQLQLNNQITTVRALILIIYKDPPTIALSYHLHYHSLSCQLFNADIKVTSHFDIFSLFVFIAHLKYTGFFLTFIDVPIFLNRFSLLHR